MAAGDNGANSVLELVTSCVKKPFNIILCVFNKLIPAPAA